MDYEKKYKDALERARNIKFGDPNSATANVVCESIFPELVESEGEKIRKEIINYFKCQSREESSRKDIHNKWIVWLEKQGDYNKLVEEMKERKKLISKEKEKVTSTNGKLSLSGRIAILEELLAFTKEKQGEQKETPCDRCKKAQPYHSCQDITELGRCYLELEKQSKQNSTNSYCQDNCKGFQETGKCFADGECKAKKEAKQKPARSEKDFDDFFNLESVIDIVEMYGKGEAPLYGDDVTSELEWLKSLRDKVYWKPTDGQMQALELVVQYHAFADQDKREKIVALFNDLKKL